MCSSRLDNSAEFKELYNLKDVQNIAQREERKYTSVGIFLEQSRFQLYTLPFCFLCKELYLLSLLLQDKLQMVHRLFCLFRKSFRHLRTDISSSEVDDFWSKISNNTQIFFW